MTSNEKIAPSYMPDETAYLIFNGPVNDATVKQAISEIGTTMSECSPKILYLALSTTGGLTAPALAFYSFLRSLPVSVVTHNISMTNSTGITVYLAGDTRLVNGQASFTFHSYSFTLPKDSEWRIRDFETKINQLRSEEETAIAITAEHTQLSEEQARGLFSQGGILLAPVAVSYQVAHHIQEFSLPPGATFIQLG